MISKTSTDSNKRYPNGNRCLPHMSKKGGFLKKCKDL